MRNFIRELLEAAALFLLIFLALHFSIQNFRIDGTSMSPTLINEQHVIVSKLALTRIDPAALRQHIPFVEEPKGSLLFSFRPPGLGDIVALKYPIDPSQSLVKRVVGLPGDEIKINAGQVLRNGEVLNESYVVNGDRRSTKVVKIPLGFYYVLGDNRRVSNDSRSWGFVSEEQIIGRAWFSYWPSERITFLHTLW